MDTKVLNQKRDHAIDKIEADMLSNFPAVHLKTTDLFTDGLYAREMLIPVQSDGFEFVFLTSEIHNTEHMFFVSKGSLLVSTDDGDPVLIKAPYHGITKPGTRRVAIALEDTIWTTFHANPDNENAEEIRKKIIDKRANPLITDDLKNKMLVAKARYQLSR
jgi:hypothetical protein